MGLAKFISADKIVALICLLAVSLGAFSLNPMVSEETGRQLVDLVRISIEYDLYNERCRGTASSTKTSATNRLFISKYSTTVNQVINLYIGANERAERSKIEQDFMQKMSLMGGCNMAKKKGLQKELDEGYRRLFEQISDLP